MLDLDAAQEDLTQAGFSQRTQNNREYYADWAEFYGPAFIAELRAAKGVVEAAKELADTIEQHWPFPLTEKFRAALSQWEA